MSRLWSKVEKQNLNYIYKNNYIRLIMSESDEENYEDIDIQPNIIIKKQKETIPRLTKFERTKILSERATQLANGSKPFVEGTFQNVYQIAEEELSQNKIPFIIKRKNGTNVELWKIDELN
jgi:DNA-directed RNA polymerase subunit K/omega